MRRLAQATGLLAVMLSSCGKNPAGDFSDPDAKAVGSLISELDDALQRPSQLAALFAADAVPKGAELSKFRGLAFFLVGQPTITGNTATAKVSLERVATGDAIGQAEWTFVKEGDTWKIKSARLP